MSNHNIKTVCLHTFITCTSFVPSTSLIRNIKDLPKSGITMLLIRVWMVNFIFSKNDSHQEVNQRQTKLSNSYTDTLKCL